MRHKYQIQMEITAFRHKIDKIILNCYQILIVTCKAYGRFSLNDPLANETGKSLRNHHISPNNRSMPPLRFRVQLSHFPHLIFRSPPVIYRVLLECCRMGGRRLKMSTVTERPGSHSNAANDL